MRKRVSWEVIEGCKYTYYDTRKQALEHARKAREQGHTVEMNRWQLVGDETSSQPVDFEALIAKQDAAQQKALTSQTETRIEIPAAVWADVVRALSF